MFYKGWATIIMIQIIQFHFKNSSIKGFYKL